MRRRRLDAGRPRWVRHPLVTDFSSDSELAGWAELADSGNPIKLATRTLDRYFRALDLTYGSDGTVDY